MRFILPALAAASLAACAGAPSTVYAPASSTANGTGYEDIRIESDRWRVSFTGAGEASDAEVERLALRRAAELALTNGYDWFEVVDRRIGQEGQNRSPVSVGGSVGRSWGSGGFSGTGVGIGISFNPGQQVRRTVSLEIIAGSGETRPDRAYDAITVAGGMDGPQP
jgi:hypothetical protein